MNKDEKLVFAMGKGDDGVPVVILGVSDAAWEFMKNGMTHTLDLTSLGHGFKLVVFGGRNHEQIKSLIPQGPDTFDASGLDLSLPNPEEA